MIGFNISVSGIEAGLTRLNVAANNIANLNTPAFKSSDVNQADTLVGGTQIDSISVRFNQGPLEIDGGSFSLAINGDGFFKVQTPQGDRFTRAGSFHVDANGDLAAADGAKLGINVPSTAQSLQVAADGTVSATLPGGTVRKLGQIGLYRFANPGGLSQEGDNLFSPTAASGDSIQGAPGSSIIFGAVEGSDVDLTREMVNLIVAKAGVQANIKALKAQSETLGDIVDLRG